MACESQQITAQLYGLARPEDGEAVLHSRIGHGHLIKRSKRFTHSFKHVRGQS
jgi:hypothetical protein